MHVLGNSLGARVALEPARRGRARSVMAIAPSGLSVLPERVVQGSGMALARVVLRIGAPLVGPLSGPRSAGRRCWHRSRRARGAPPPRRPSGREGFADSRDFRRTPLWELLLDVPRGLDRIDCPVTLLRGVADRAASGQTVRHLPLVPRSRFVPLLWAATRRSPTGHGRSSGSSRRPPAVPISPRTPPR